MTTPQLRRRGRPNDLRGNLHGEWANSPSGYLAPRPGQVHDRTSQDLLINAQVVAVEVDDPHALDFGDKIVVLRSTRNDPLSDMRSRDQIDECDYRAGRHWQDAHENSQIGSIRAIDPSKEHVDGGCPPEMLTDRQRKGASDVNLAAMELGPFGNALVYSVLSDGLSIRRAGMQRGMTSGRAQMALGEKFRECLSKLAVLFGFAMKVRQ